MTTGQHIEFPRPDSTVGGGYLAEPEGPSKGALIVIQEWWGLNPQIKAMCDRFAKEGFRALAPDLYHGEVAKTAEEASHKMSHLDFGKAVTQDITGAAHFFGTHDKIGILGFCMGGALTLLSSALLPYFSAASCFYGIPPAEAADLSKIAIPLQCHFATNDDWCNAEARAKLQETLAQGKVNFEYHEYEAPHAFMNQARPEVYTPEVANLAWERTIQFMSKNLA